MRRTEFGKTDEVETADLTIGPDIEIIPSAEELSAVTLEPDLSLHIEPISAPPAPARRRLIDYFGPEVTAGIVISILFAIFAGLMLLGVNDQPDTPLVEEPSVVEPVPVAPLEEVPVEIGEGVTLERE